MDLPIKELIAGIVALCVAYVGYIQWKRGKRSGRFIDDRESAYKEVWQSLEDIHLYVRAGAVEPQTFDQMVARANALLIRHGLHIADADKESCAGYIAALRTFGDLLSSAQVSALVKREVAITGEHPALPSELLDAYVENQNARKIVMDRFRHAIGANQI